MEQDRWLGREALLWELETWRQTDVKLIVLREKHHMGSDPGSGEQFMCWPWNVCTSKENHCPSPSSCSRDNRTKEGR